MSVGGGEKRSRRRLGSGGGRVYVQREYESPFVSR